MQAIQVFISSVRPSAVLLTKFSSANNGRAIETISAIPSLKMLSATFGSLIRFEVTIGILRCGRNLPVTQANAARGTIMPIVGIRASCQPIPVFMRDAPAFSTRCPSSTTSSKLLPSSTKSRQERRKIIRKSSPDSSRTRSTIFRAKRIRFLKDPPHSSLRLFVHFAMN